MQQSEIILLGSKAHVGKDTLGDLIVSNQGYYRFGFADKLKEVVSDLYGFSHEQMHGDLKNIPDLRYPRDGIGFSSNPSDYYTPREILQDFGQEQRRRFPDIWADYVCRQIVKFDPSAKLNYVITDFRFPNEHTVVKRYAEKYGWMVRAIEVIRPVTLRGEVAGSDNISETALDDFPWWTHRVFNDSNSKEELYSKYLELSRHS